MSNLSIYFILAICTILLGILAFADQISKKKHFKFFNRIFFKITVIIFTALIGGILTYIKETNSEIELKNDQSKRDSLNNLKIITKLESSNKQTIELLAIYGLKIDSSQSKIEKIINDSSKIVNNIYNTEDPNLELSNIIIDSISSKQIFFKLSFHSSDATSNFIDFYVDVICTDKEKKDFLIYYSKKRTLPLNSIINKNSSHTTTFVTGNILYKYQYYIFHLKGSYKKFDNKTIPLDRFYAYDFGGKASPKFGIPDADFELKIKLFLEMNQTKYEFSK